MKIVQNFVLKKNVFPILQIEDCQYTICHTLKLRVSNSKKKSIKN